MPADVSTQELISHAALTIKNTLNRAADIGGGVKQSPVHVEEVGGISGNQF